MTRRSGRESGSRGRRISYLRRHKQKRSNYCLGFEIYCTDKAVGLLYLLIIHLHLVADCMFGFINLYLI